MASHPADLRVLVVADDPLARAGLATLLAKQDGCTVVGQVAGGPDLDWAAELAIFNPDIVLWDLGWDSSPDASDPSLAGLESLADALRDSGESPTSPLLALLPDESLAIQAWAAGVRGLLPRDASAERLVAALEGLSEGLVTLDPVVATPLLPSDTHLDMTPAEALTPRELEVLQLLAEGLANKAIALRLGISDHTVKFHVNAILGKLDAQSRTEAVVRATRLGLIIL
jgi:DNA-binding NarL/FixJ family response regulator